MEPLEKISLVEGGIEREIHPKALKRALVGFFGRGEKYVPKMEAYCLLVRKGLIGSTIKAKRLLDFLEGRKLSYGLNSLLIIENSGEHYKVGVWLEEEW